MRQIVLLSIMFVSLQAAEFFYRIDRVGDDGMGLRFDIFAHRCDDKLDFNYSCNEPSFGCYTLNLNAAEKEICWGTHELNQGKDAEELPFLDNLFTSYYNIIMKHIPKSEKSKVRQIAREAMKNRDKIDFDTCIQKWQNSGLFASCIDEQIAESYWQGLHQLSFYILEQNPILFAKIFHQYTDVYKEVFMKQDRQNYDFSFYELIGNLYLDGLIDKNGKLTFDD